MIRLHPIVKGLAAMTLYAAIPYDRDKILITSCIPLCAISMASSAVSPQVRSDAPSLPAAPPIFSCKSVPPTTLTAFAGLNLTLTCNASANRQSVRSVGVRTARSRSATVARGTPIRSPSWR